MSTSDITQIGDNLSKFEFIGSLGDFFEGFINDITRLFNIMPTWLQSFIVIVFSIMLFICALRVVAYVLDAIPFV